MTTLGGTYLVSHDELSRQDTRQEMASSQQTIDKVNVYGPDISGESELPFLRRPHLLSRESHWMGTERVPPHYSPP